LHRRNPHYGVSSGKHVPTVLAIAEAMNTTDVLDYGCGKGRLKAGLNGALNVQEYDPAIEGKEATPTPADLVICTDVLEHIEPDCIDDVLDDIVRCTKRLALLSVAMRLASKTLPDGRNAHVLLKDRDWWVAKIGHRFRIISIVESKWHELTLLVSGEA
jgi:2-polyprenyl-3-methyl-5-hydroxy-6-metoxy-1,4-benzoquinol methylase